MINPRNIAIADYDYDLPDGRIAKYPLAQRNQSKLLVWRDGEIEDMYFYDLPGQIEPDALVVFNDTRVIQARLHFHKSTGALIEVFCLEPCEPRDYAQNFASTSECTWTCLVGNSKKWKDGVLEQPIDVAGRRVTLTCRREGEAGASQRIRFEWDGGVSFAQVLDAVGELPIPPYLNRQTEESDKTTYQTVYSHVDGSVAAPTAGLHFTDRELDELRRRGVDLAYLTLHVGAGTFRPVKSTTIEGHAMHTEFIAVPRDVLLRVRQQLASQRRLVSVGTTSVRTLESLYYVGKKILKAGDSVDGDSLVVGQWEPYSVDTEVSTVDAIDAILGYLDARHLQSLVTSTQILIAPGFRFRIVDAMVTNFHMPQSTLLLLVSAFVGTDASTGAERWRDIYRHAMSHDYRFLSYGDSSLLVRRV